MPKLVKGTDLKSVGYCSLACSSHVPGTTPKEKKMIIPRSLPKRYFIVRQTDNKGEGLFSRYPIFKDSYVGEYIGPRYPIEELKDFVEGENFYTFSTSDGYFIDGSTERNIMRKMNHSCQPNVEVVEMLDTQGNTRILFYAKKNISTDEELCFDYRVTTTKTNMKSLARYRCHCESKYCRGTMLDLTLLNAGLDLK